MSTAFRVCPLCEATCGLELTIAGGRVTAARGDADHVLSHGFICPKGVAFPELVEDPDRLRRPLVRQDGELRETSWEEAFRAVGAGLRQIRAAHGNDAVGLYVGNPSVHTMAGGPYLVPLLKALSTRNYYTAATADQMPKHVACGYLYGDPFAIPVPDLDRSDFLLILGANPWDSNGSLATAPDFRGRLKALQRRGGRFVVVDPRRTATARHADRHLAVRPGTDALLLFAVLNVLFAERLTNLGRLAGHVSGVEEVAGLAATFTPERAAPACGVAPADIVTLAHDLAAARAAAVYGRIGTCTVEFGTVTSWLVDVLNVVTGNLDRPGGAMFPLAPHLRKHARPGGPGFATGRWKSRVRGCPEVLGQLPVATLADEIEAPGEGQVRALVTIAGNPSRSAPNSARLEAALGSLEFMVSVDPYLNETTRHADVILPPTDPARVGHYDYNFLVLSIRNLAVYSPPALPRSEEELDDPEIWVRLVAAVTGEEPAAVHEATLRRALDRAVADESSPVFGRDVAELLPLVRGDEPPERMLDAALRAGAYGDGFGAVPGGLSLDRLLEQPHGIDLGPLQPRLPELLKTPSGRIELCPPAIAADVPRLVARLETPVNGGFLLVGRRHLRSNNSWMHNLPMLAAGPERCTLQVHPDDAARLGVSAGACARVTSRVGCVVAPVEVTAEVAPGVVSLPHGWGHDAPGARLSTAAVRPGVNSNLVSDDAAVDPLSGNAVLNAIPVQVELA